MTAETFEIVAVAGRALAVSGTVVGLALLLWLFVVENIDD